MRTAFLLFTTSLVILMTGCSTTKEDIRAALKSDPEIVYEALGANPARLAEVMQKASMEANRVAQARAEEEDKARVDKELKNPLKPEINEDRALRGSKDAGIVVVEYSDFQCPYCKRGFETVEELRAKYGPKMLFVFKHLPLDFHPMAMPAAKRFEAIALQSQEKAYKFHDEVFKNQEKLGQGGEKFLDEMAKKVGANMAKMKTDMVSEKVAARINADKDEAAKFGMSGTPGFIVAGVSLKGAYPMAAFENILSKRAVSGSN